MNDEIQLIADGDGLAVIGEPTAVGRFLAAEGLPSRELDLPRLSRLGGTAAQLAQAGSEVTANSGRWVQLSAESAKKVEKYGLRQSSASKLHTGVIQGKKPGQIGGFVEFSRGPGSVLGNPALLAGAAGIMAQLAMQQTMDEITDYLAAIDAKVDDILRAHQDAVLADMLGVEAVIDEAMTVRDHVGRVSEVTWSKVQATSFTIARTQGYALRQLEALAERLEKKRGIGELADTAKEAETRVQEWLAVLAHCFQLQDAIAILELDRVLDAAPDELDRHRLALRTARDRRIEHIVASTQILLTRMNEAATRANTRVLYNPRQSPEVVRSSNKVATDVHDLHGRLGIEHVRGSVETRRWSEAAGETKTWVLEAGSDGLGAARDRGAEAVDLAKSVTGKLSERFGKRRRED